MADENEGGAAPSATTTIEDRLSKLEADVAALAKPVVVEAESKLDLLIAELDKHGIRLPQDEPTPNAEVQA